MTDTDPTPEGTPSDSHTKDALEDAANTIAFLEGSLEGSRQNVADLTHQLEVSQAFGRAALKTIDDHQATMDEQATLIEGCVKAEVDSSKDMVQLQQKMASQAERIEVQAGQVLAGVGQVMRLEEKVLEQNALLSKERMLKLEMLQLLEKFKV